MVSLYHASFLPHYWGALHSSGITIPTLFWFPISFLLALTPTCLPLYPEYVSWPFQDPVSITTLSLSAQATLLVSQASADICILGASHSPREPYLHAELHSLLYRTTCCKTVPTPLPPLISKSIAFVCQEPAVVWLYFMLFLESSPWLQPDLISIFFFYSLQ